jgi:hypothetical protein
VGNQAGAGRGLDQLFQFLGGHLERRVAVALVGWVMAPLLWKDEL